MLYNSIFLVCWFFVNFLSIVCCWLGKKQHQQIWQWNTLFDWSFDQYSPAASSPNCAIRRMQNQATRQKDHRRQSHLCWRRDRLVFSSFRGLLTQHLTRIFDEFRKKFSQWSISSTFYVQIFCSKVFLAAFSTYM
jgi:hypothetical protein